MIIDGAVGVLVVMATMVGGHVMVVLVGDHLTIHAISCLPIPR